MGPAWPTIYHNRCLYCGLFIGKVISIQISVMGLLYKYVINRHFQCMNKKTLHFEYFIFQFCWLHFMWSRRLFLYQGNDIYRADSTGIVLVYLCLFLSVYYGCLNTPPYQRMHCVYFWSDFKHMRKSLSPIGVR